MRLKSDGLGKTEIEAKIVAVRKVDDLVIFFLDTIKPAKWHTRMGFQERDLRDLVLAILRPRNLWFIFQALMFPNKKLPRTEDF